MLILLLLVRTSFRGAHMFSRREKMMLVLRLTVVMLDNGRFGTISSVTPRTIVFTSAAASSIRSATALLSVLRVLRLHRLSSAVVVHLTHRPMSHLSMVLFVFNFVWFGFA